MICPECHEEAIELDEADWSAVCDWCRTYFKIELIKEDCK